jgi:hypothetical protein
MKRQVAILSLIFILLSTISRSAVAGPFTGPTVSDISGLAAIKGFGKTIFLSATSPEGCPLTYAIASGPTNGTISQFNPATGALIYTSNPSYTGSDSFTFHASAFTTAVCTATTVTSSNATVSLTVVDTTTVIHGHLQNPDGTPRSGKVQWKLVQPAVTFDGAYITSNSVVERTLDSSGSYIVSLYPTIGLGPNSYYVATLVTSSSTEPLGIYKIPSTNGGFIDQSGLEANKVTTIQGTAPVSIATTTQVEALVGSVVGVAASATSAATSAASAATDAANSAASAAGSAAIAHNYDIVAMNVGLTTSSQKILIMPANRSFTLALTGSTCVAETAATAQTDFGVWVGTATSNGTQKATLRFAASGTTCSVVSATSTSISPGDVIRIVGPSSPDNTLSNIAFNLKANLP